MTIAHFLSAIFASVASGSAGILLLTLLLTPLISCLVVTILRKREAVQTITTISTSLILIQTIILVFSIIEQGGVSAFSGQLLYADAFSAVILIPIAGLGFVSALYSINYMGRQYENGIIDESRLLRYYQLFNAFLFTMLLVPISNNTGLMWIAIEATTLVSVLLIMLYDSGNAIEAAWKYLTLATIGLSLAFFGTVLFNYAAMSASHGSDLMPSSDTMNWTTMVEYGKLLDPNIVKLAFVFVMVGYGTKAGLAPMHTWLPDAHSEAPTPVSALLSGVLLNCALYAIIRFQAISSDAIGTLFSNELLIAMGIISVAIAAASIYFQKDMKRMLAYSSVEHMGLVSLAIGFGGFYGALLQMINHSVVKPLMFFASGTISQKYKTKAMSEITGVIKTMPITGALFLIGGLAIVGMPPFNIFSSEFAILSSGFSSGQFFASVVVTLLLVVIFAGFTKHVIKMVFGNPRNGMKQDDLGLLAVIPMVILCALTIILGFYLPETLHTLIADAMKVLG